MKRKDKRLGLLCECGDSGCPIHEGKNECSKSPTCIVRRIDMDKGTTKFSMCNGCASDALDSGVFDLVA
jgi:hypothetical protein